MTHRIDVQPDSRTVCVTHEGDVDLTDLESARARAVAMLTQHGYSRLLLDMRAMVGQPTVTEHHRFASTQPLYMPPHIAVAVLMSVHEFNTKRFSEDLSVRQGVLLKAFDDMEDARAWLARITN